MKNIFFGNASCLNMLTYANTSKHINHSYLISGETGFGKKTFSKIFAKSILCTSSGNKPCDECNNCINIEKNNHPDVCFLNYEKHSSITVDNVRAIIKDIYIKPNQGQYKIYVICNIEDITISGANALLKILEEPPPHGIFIITCKNSKLIPNTIVSRCVCLTVTPLDYEDYRLALGDKTELSQQDIKKYFLFFQGNIGKSLDYISNQDKLIDALNFTNSISIQKEYEVLLKLSQYENDKEKLIELLQNSQIILRQVLMLKLKKIESCELFYSDINNISNSLTLSQTTKLIELMIQRENLLNTNANLSLGINVMCCDIKNILI